MSSFSEINIDGQSNLFSIRWTSTRLGSMNTGFSMTVSGLNLNNKKTITGTLDGNTFSLGDDNGIITSLGSYVSRNNRSEVTIIADPFGEFLQKIVVIKSGAAGEADVARAGFAAISTSSNTIRFIDYSSFNDALFSNYYKGDIEGFLSAVIGDIPVIIDYSKVKESPIVKAMSNSPQLAANSFEKDPTVINMSIGNTVTTVGDIINKYISPIGLEFYYIGNKTYELTTPKMTHSGSDCSIILKDSDVVEFNSAIDPHAAPDIVIPSMPGYDFIGSYAGSNTIVENALEKSFQTTSGNSGYIKVKTYTVPSMFYGAYDNAMRELDKSRRENSDTAKNTGEGTPVESDKTYEYMVRTFYQQMAQKSSLLQTQTGTAVLDFMPTITHGYQWFEFRGKKYFMGSVEHYLARGRATTTLQIIGAEGDFKPLEYSPSTKVPENKRTKEVKSESTTKIKNEQTKILKASLKKGKGKNRRTTIKKCASPNPSVEECWGSDEEWVKVKTTCAVTLLS